MIWPSWQIFSPAPPTAANSKVNNMPILTGLDMDERTAYEVRQKGWCGLAELQFEDGKVLSLSFWNPIRLSQELNGHFAAGARVWAEPNVIVVSDLTQESMKAAVFELIEKGYFDT